VGLEFSKEFVLFFLGLETTVAELGRSVDEFEGDLLEGGSGSLRDESFAKSEDPLLDADGRAFDHQKVFSDEAIMRETAHRVDGLLCEVEWSRARVLVSTFADSIDLLVDLGTMMIAVLTGAWNAPLDTRRMPGSNTSDLSKTLVSFAWETGSSPTSSDALVTLTLRDTDNIDHLALLKDA